MKITPCKGKTSGFGNQKYPYLNSLRCGAKTRQGMPCKAPAIKGKQRCRMHGGKGSGAPKCSQNALKHGYYTAESINNRKEVETLIKASRNLIKASTK